MASASAVVEDWDPLADPADGPIGTTGLDGWDPFADPADEPSQADEAWKPPVRRRKSASAFAFPFPESEGETDDDSSMEEFPSGGGPQPAHWGEDPALEALSCSFGMLAPAKAQDEQEPESEDEEEGDEDDENLPVLIDDGDLGPRTRRLLRALGSADLDEFEVFGDVQTHGELRDLTLQACVISKACFSGGGTFRMTEGRHLSLLVDTVRCVTVGYCLYTLAAVQKETPRILILEELGVAEAHRQKGLGSKLLHWAQEAARTERCSSLSLSAPHGLERLLEPMGFQAIAAERGSGPGRPGNTRWTLRLDLGLPGRRSPLPDRTTLDERGRALEDLAEDAQGRPRLVCFLASHISSRERLDRLSDTLTSIAHQEPYGPPEVFMSWSATTKDFRDQARTLLKSFNGLLPGLRAMEQEGQLSQFLHHAAALRKAGAGLRADGWVLFSDDDDLWHPRRYAEFLYAASKVHGDTNVKSVSALGHAQLRLNVEPRAVEPKDVDKLLMQGSAVCLLTDAEKKATDIPEYFDVAVRNEQFKNFLLRTPRTILASKFCDRRFVLQFSVQGWGVCWFRPTCWLYFYSRADGITLAEDGSYKGGASFAVNVATADREFAARYARTRPSANGHPVASMTVEEVAFLIASLRASIEEQGITLEGLDKGWVRAEQLRVVCAMAVQSRVGLTEADGRLWTWACDAAWEVAREVNKAFQVQIAE